MESFLLFCTVGRKWAFLVRGRKEVRWVVGMREGPVPPSFGVETSMLNSIHEEFKKIKINTYTSVKMYQTNHEFPDLVLICQFHVVERF